MKNNILAFALFFFGSILIQPELLAQATGGTVTISNGQRIHTFTAINQSLTYTAATDTLTNVKFTIVGGGGAGGGCKTGSGAQDGAGGGGGGVYDMSTPAPSNWVNLPFQITSNIGAGGTGVAAAAGNVGTSTEVTWNGLKYYATGGVGGGFATNGGSSGTFGTRATTVTTALAAGGGNTGGTSTAKVLGGGGGSNGVGLIGVTNAGTRTGGAGGPGTTSSVNSSVYGSGGGGSAGTVGGSGGTNAGSGGANGNGSAATANFGGGGGGSDGLASGAGGAGGSGTVILSYNAYDIYNSTSSAAYNPNGFVNGSASTGTNKRFRGAFTTTCSTTVDFTSDILIIESGHNLIVASGGTLTCGAIWINSGATLTVSGGTLNCGPITKNGTITYTSGSINATYANVGYTITSTTYNNLTISGTGVFSVGGNLIVTGTLSIATSGILNLNGNNLQAVNAFSGTGTIRGSSTSSIYITGSSAGSFYMDQTANLTTNRLKYLGLAASATATLGNRLVVYGDTSYSGVVDLRTSSVLTTNTTATEAARLVFKYNITDDRHGNIGYNGGIISGEAMVEDCFPAANMRGYRQLGHTLDSAMSLNQITDDLDLYGVISGGTSGRGNNRDGLIAATATALNSIFLYDEKSGSGSKWVPFTTNTLTNNVIPFATSAMYVMRPAGTGEAGSYNAQLIDYEGQVTFGSKTFTCKRLTIGNYGHNLLSNPYLTCLDFDKFLTTNDNNLTAKGFKKYNKETKNYIDHVKGGGGWQKGGSAITKPNVHPGDAFWVQVTSDNAVLSFTESMLTNDPASDVSKGNKLEIDSTLYNTLLMKLSSGQDSTIGDEIVLLNASWGKSLSFSHGDMYNANGTCIDLSVEGGNQEKISFKTLPISTDCIIPCFVAACASGTYTFNFDINYNKPVEAMKYRLLDKFTGKQLDIKAGDNYKFSIDLNDSRSFGSGRFYINCIANTLDNENINKGTSEYSIYPNPVSKTEALTIARNASSGKIGTVSLLNQLGQVIYSKKITNEMGLEVLNLSSLEIQPGIYFLQLEGNNGTEAIKLVIK